MVKNLFRVNTNQHNIVKQFEKIDNIIKSHIQVSTKKMVYFQKYAFKVVKYKISVIKLNKKSK